MGCNRKLKITYIQVQNSLRRHFGSWDVETCYYTNSNAGHTVPKSLTSGYTDPTLTTDIVLILNTANLVLVSDTKEPHEWLQHECLQVDRGTEIVFMLSTEQDESRPINAMCPNSQQYQECAGHQPTPVPTCTTMDLDPHQADWTHPRGAPHTRWLDIIT